MSTEQIIEIITAAGLDYHDFRCGVIAKRSAWGPVENVWEEIANFPSRYNREAIARAWELAGMADPYADGEAA